MKLLFDESLSPRLVSLLRDLFRESESALRNGLARVGDRRILEYAATHDFVLVSTDGDFQRLLMQFPSAKVVILRSCDYPTETAADVLRRNAIRIAELPLHRIHSSFSTGSFRSEIVRRAHACVTSPYHATLS